MLTFATIDLEINIKHKRITTNGISKKEATSHKATSKRADAQQRLTVLGMHSDFKRVCPIYFSFPKVMLAAKSITI